MATHKEIEKLLKSYEIYVGTGNMKQAGRLLPVMIRALVDFVEERAPAVAKGSEPCAPCDVSLSDNDLLMEEFKKDVVATAVAKPDAVEEPVVEEPVEEVVEEAAPQAHALHHTDDHSSAKNDDPVHSEHVHNVNEVVHETAVEPVEETAPAPKTAKKPKAS